MNILDLFSGAGGLTEGFRTEPFDIIAHVEADKDACLTLKTREAFHYLNNHNQLNVYYAYLKNEITRDELYSYIPNENLSSILNYEINPENMPLLFNEIDSRLGINSVDGIIGGPPCQAYSTIGRARNVYKKESDERIYLYEHYIEFIQKYDPNFFIFENVKGLLSFKDIHNELLFPKIIQAFEQVGYNIEYKLLNASDYGVSQKRERLFIVGTKQTLNFNFNFFDTLNMLRQEPPHIDELFSDLPPLQNGNTSTKYLDIALSEYKELYIRPNFESPLTYHIARPHNERDLNIYRIAVLEKQNGNNLKYDSLPQTLQTHKNTKDFVDRFKALDYNDISHTVVAHISKDGHYYIHPDIEQNRSITVREAARIQGFPDDFFFETSRTAAFKQIGNAVPPILSKKIAESITYILNL